VLALLMMTASAAASELALYLDVSINGIPTQKIAAFSMLADGTIACPPSELVEIGLDVPAELRAADKLALTELFGATYTYDEPAQAIDIIINDNQRQSQLFDASPTALAPIDHGVGLSAALNYDLSVSSGKLMGSAWWEDARAYASLQGKLFTPLGRLEQTGQFNVQPGGSLQVARGDTSFIHTDISNGLSYQAGDLKIASLPWTRGIRLGGLGVQTNFEVRPDLLTTPAFAMEGTAAVPSTMDVFVNNTKILTETVSPGPFDVLNVPVNVGPGLARLVLTDADGSISETTVPYYASARLLRPSLAQWSVQAGFARFSYGMDGDTYGTQPVAIGSLRYGLSNTVTLEAHAEAGAGIINAGLGTVNTIGSVGLLSGSVSVSAGENGVGGQINLAGETAWNGWTLSGSVMRSFGIYDDLAVATARKQFVADLRHPYPAQSPPLAAERLSITTPELAPQAGALGINLLHAINAGGDSSSIASLSYSRSTAYGGTLYANAFHDFSSAGSGLTFGLSVPMGADISAATYASTSDGATVLVAEATKQLGMLPGDIGWRVRTSHAEGLQVQAGVGYRFNGGTTQLSLAQSDTELSGSLQMRGALAWADNSFFVSDQIGDAFVVVDAGHADVPVLYENQPVGTTDSNGKILVPTFAPFQSRRLSIDPTNLPPDVEVGAPSRLVTPGDRGGVIVEFEIASTAEAALVDLVDASGKAIPVGASGTTASGEQFLVGYDGQAYVQELLSSNHITLSLPSGGTCEGHFDYHATPGVQGRVGPVVCS
jgi:outer membrane usher protein